jgi:hypothetical protein
VSVLLELDAALAEARTRLAWLLDEYGPDDIDFVTFAPIVDALQEGIEREREATST